MQKKARIPVVIAIIVCLFVVLRFFQPPEDESDATAPGAVPSPGSDATCVSQLPADQRTAAISAWIDGSLPSEVAGTQECDFYDFAWQSFLALTAPVAGTESGYVFTGWGSSNALFPPAGDVPPPFPSSPAERIVASPVLGKTGASLSASLDPALVGDLVALRQASLDAGDLSAEDISAGDFEQAASLVPYTDANGRWVHYSVLSNQIEYEFVADQGLYASDCYNAWGGSTAGTVTYDATTGDVAVTCADTGSDSSQNSSPSSSTSTHLCQASVTPDPMPQMPTGAIELKLAWRVLETCDLPDSPSPCTPEDASSYLVVPGVVDPYSPTVGQQDVTLALIGFHVVTRSAEYPDGIWATFEYSGNAADCPASGPTGLQNMFCTPCPFDVSQWSSGLQQTVQDQVTAGDATLDDSGNLVCSRNPGAFNLATPAFYDPGTGDGQCSGMPIATDLCRVDPIPQTVAQLNTWVDEVLAASTSDSTSVLANYELVGVMWLNQDCRSHSDCAEQGTLKLTNTTMETFEQALDLSSVNAGTGCLVCHATNQFNPNPFSSKPFARGLADRSLLFYRIQQQEGEECTAPPASYSCPPCSSEMGRPEIGRPDLEPRLTGS